MRAIVTGAVIAAASLACGSTAPYTVTSAAINSGLALGAAAHERAAGGCYAVCTMGTVCNAKTGYCEREPEPCLRGSPECDRNVRAPLNVDELLSLPGGSAGPALGVSPTTGRAPPPPGATGTEQR